MKHTSYRDGGTLLFELPFISRAYRVKTNEVCKDRRGMKTDGEWWFGYPEKEGSRLMTEEEKSEILPIIAERLQSEIRVVEFRLEDVIAGIKTKL